VTRFRADGLAQLMVVLGIVVLAGWGRGAVTLAVAGGVGIAVCGLLRFWARHCLSSVDYQRQLDQHRACFGEDVPLRVAITNDKLLPLPWVSFEDEIKGRLAIRDATIVERGSSQAFTQVLAIGPYQRVERRLSVTCGRRGLHRLGPVRLASGDPVGCRTLTKRIDVFDELLVYPKVFTLGPPGIVPDVLLGDARAARRAMEDPTRVVGHRQYRPGDALRMIDWRATARSPIALVRVCEPTANLRVALFLDCSVPQLKWPDMAPRGAGVGLFSAATVDGRPIAHPPSTSPDTLATILESLARASPFGRALFADVLEMGLGQLARGTSAVVVAGDFPEATNLAMARMRTRHPVTTVGVVTDQGCRPPAGVVDHHLQAVYVDDWPTRSVLDVAS